MCTPPAFEQFFTTEIINDILYLFIHHMTYNLIVLLENLVAIEFGYSH